MESDIDFTANASNPLNTGNPFANALLGVYNSYTQANAKPYQDYLYHDVSWYVQDTWKITPRLTLDLGVRFSWYQPVYNRAGDGSFFTPGRCSTHRRPRASTGRSAWAPLPVPRAPPPTAPSIRPYRPTPTLANTQPGFYVGKLVPEFRQFHQRADAGLRRVIPRAASKRDKILPQPRLGFAWDVFGNHKTVVRGGFGITYDRYQSGITGFGATNPPFVLNPTLQFGYLQDIQPGGGGILSPSAITGVNKKSAFPTIYSYSIGVQQNVGGSTVVDVSYVGSKSRNLARKVNLNSPAYGAAFKAGGAGSDQLYQRRDSRNGNRLACRARGRRTGLQRRHRSSHRFPASLSGLQRHHLLLL